MMENVGWEFREAENIAALCIFAMEIKKLLFMYTI